MSCAQCQGIVQEFDGRVARRELRRFRRRGPSGTTGLLLDAILARGVSGRSLLDIGGGVGAIQHAVMAAGASGGTSVDASPAYLSAARSEAASLGYQDRMSYVEGDFVKLAPDLDAADIVTLDRVVCCYPDMPALIDASAPRARHLYGLVFPREHLPMRMGAFLLNLFQRIRRRPFRVFLHGTDAVDARVRSHGFHRIWHGRSLFWQAWLYRRDGAAGNGAAGDGAAGNGAAGNAAAGNAAAGNAAAGNATAGNATAGNATAGNATAGTATAGTATAGTATAGTATAGNAASRDGSAGVGSAGNEPSGSGSAGRQSAGNGSAGNESARAEAPRAESPRAEAPGHEPAGDGASRSHDRSPALEGPARDPRPDPSTRAA